MSDQSRQNAPTSSYEERVERRERRDAAQRAAVEPFLPEFDRCHAEILAAGAYPYNDSFKGKIPGLADIAEVSEDTAIYLLQNLHALALLDERVAGAIADGYEPIETLTGVERFAGVVHYGFCSGGTGWEQWHDARLLPETKPHQIEVTGPVRGVLPKGKRTHGHLLYGGHVLVKRNATKPVDSAQSIQTPDRTERSV